MDSTTIMIIVAVLVLIVLLIIAGVWSNNKARANGASWVQIYTGKKIGELCASDAMCSTNKCVNKFCML
jgi:hypothetical protein